MSDKIIVSDGLSEIDEDALKFCLSCEGDVYYHALEDGKGKRLLYELLSVNGKCRVTEIDDDELNDMLKSEEAYKVHLFFKKRGRGIEIGLAAGLAILIFGIVVGNKLAKK